MVAFVPRRCAARSGSAPSAGADQAHDTVLAELEAAREAKYRELRDADLDHRTGKLSDADYEELDRHLRGEAIEILRDLDIDRRANHRPSLTMSTVLGFVQVFLCVVLVFLILMHSGKDAGLSGAFGVGTGAGPFGGGSLVERNLNRWTVGFAIAFVVNTIILIKIA